MTRNTKTIVGLGLFALVVALGFWALMRNSPAAGDGVIAPDGPAGVTNVAARAHGDTITVYRSPTCGCCRAWEDHLREAGYTIESIETAAVDVVKDEHGVPQPLRSCHTALVGGYVIEGHVPAEDIARLLEQRPDIHGLAVPGMPASSPGMAVPGREHEPFDVFAFSEAGDAEVWATR